LPEQRHFLHALRREFRHFGQHVFEAARHFLAARVRHYAERAVLAAAFHDGDESARAFHARRRQVIELLDFRKRDVDLRLAARAPRFDHLRQAMERLRAEHEIHVWRALHDRRAFLARHAAADADDEIGLLALQELHAAEIVEHALLRLFAHRAGVEQQNVRLVGIIRLLDAAFGEHVGHLVRIVLVHLTAEGAYVELLRHVSAACSRSSPARPA
jgi:hypothetical protein